MRWGSFYEELSFNTICNITQEPQELQRHNRPCRFMGKSALIKCHQLRSKNTSIKRRSLFDQLATDTKYPYPLRNLNYDDFFL